MSKDAFKPYENESDSIQLGGLTIENRLDRISIYGSTDLTRDKAGLSAAKKLKSIIDQTLNVLENGDLPDQIPLEKSETVENPFA